jgi:CRISPR-associated protein Csx3
MRNELPAILIGGPPHAGKSVLLFHLTRALYEQDVPHYAIRACPDGEGNWFQEGAPKTAESIRVENKRAWSNEFVRLINEDLQHRCLPFLVDMGGDPREDQLSLFQQCTHSILLLRDDKPDFTHLWQTLTTEANLLPMARLFSQQNGVSAITSLSPLQGTITGLERQSHAVRTDPVFLALLEQITTLFNSYSSQDMQRVFLQQAPTEIVLDLPTELRAFTVESRMWEPAMLAPFLARVPANTPLSVYGSGPNWIYAALAAHADQQPFYQFDPKLSGWIQPGLVRIGEEPCEEVITRQHKLPGTSLLSISFPVARLAYLQPQPLVFPPVSPDAGLILDGPLPHWLLTALTRLYQQAGVPWIAVHHAQQNKDGQQKTAIIIFTRNATHHIGDLLDIPNR